MSVIITNNLESTIPHDGKRPGGGSYTIYVRNSTSSPVTFTLTNNSSSFVSISHSSFTLPAGDAQVILVTIQPNTSTNTRSISLSVNYGATSHPISATQLGAPPALVEVIPTGTLGVFNPIIYERKNLTTQEFITIKDANGTTTVPLTKRPINGEVRFDLAPIIKRMMFLDKSIVNYGIVQQSNSYGFVNIMRSNSLIGGITCYYGGLQFGETLELGTFLVPSGRVEYITGRPFTVTYLPNMSGQHGYALYKQNGFTSNGVFQAVKGVAVNIPISVLSVAADDVLYLTVTPPNSSTPVADCVFDVVESTCDIIYLRWLNRQGGYRYIALKERECKYDKKKGEILQGNVESIEPVNMVYENREIFLESTIRKSVIAGRDGLNFEQWKELADIILSDEIYLYNNEAWQKVNLKTTSQKADPRKGSHTFECQIDYPLF